MDYSYTLDILLICLKEHLHTISTKSRFQEINETRLPKEKKLKRAIELLENKINDNYAERCGYVSYGVEFKELDKVDEKGQPLYEMITHATPEQKEANTNALNESRVLADKEWREFTNILYNEMDGWWK